MDSPQQRFARLLSVVLDGSCTEDEREELAQLVIEHPGFETELAEELSIHSLLQWQGEDVARDMLEMTLSEVSATCQASDLSMPRAWSGGSVTRRSLWSWAAAAVLLVVGGTLTWRYLGRDDPRAIAQLVASDGVQWSDQSTALQRGGVVQTGRLITSGGAFALKFRSGPVVHFVGPTTLNIESDMHVELERGQATAEVPKSGIGFTIKTPRVSVVDLGTKFGAAVDDEGATDVIVFEGKVDLQEKSGKQESDTRLVQGEAVRIGEFGSLERLMQVRRDSSGGWMSKDDHRFMEQVIDRVRDNIPPSDGSKFFCYQITFHGLKEDSFAYAEQPAQWNGLTAKGLPLFLRGADFVKTFNDYRYIEDFEMVVELSRPANLYVFADDRVPPPQWLKSQFEDTGVDIGLDEGPWVNVADEFMRNAPERSMDVGGGNSIDTVFSVWRRQCNDTTPVTLGDVGPRGSEGKQGRAMYGIAATPLD